MGICYSEEQQWQAYNKSIREKRRNKKKNRQGSIIHQQKSIYQSSFASKVQNSFREDLHSSIQNLVSEIGSIAIGSIVQMKEEQLKYLYQSLAKINPDGQLHFDHEPITLCNLKTKNFLHTHKISFPDLPKLHQVSCCPYNSNHIIQYDIWKLVKASQHSEVDTTHSSQNIQNIQEQSDGIQNCSYFIYHPFTQRFLNIKKGYVICSEQKMEWQVIPFGKRRNGGFIKIVCEQGQLCMTDQKGLLPNHRKLIVCKEQHISHLWQISFGQII